jgi:hypothetical protein
MRLLWVESTPVAIIGCGSMSRRECDDRLPVAEDLVARLVSALQPVEIFSRRRRGL